MTHILTLLLKALVAIIILAIPVLFIAGAAKVSRGHGRRRSDQP